MRKLAVVAAALALLAAPAAYAQTIYAPGQAGAVGSVVTATGTNGQSVRVVEPHIICDSGCAGGTGVSASQVQGTSASGATDDGSNPVKIGSVYTTVPPTYTTGQRGVPYMGSRGSLAVTLTSSNGTGTPSVGTPSDASAAAASLYVDAQNQSFNGTAWDSSRTINGAVAVGNAGTGTTAVERAGFKFSEITTATTTAVQSGASILHRVSVNTCVASATVKVYNALTATGTPITITCPVTVTDPFFIDYDAYFGTGITVVTSGATDVTVGYR